MFTICRSPREPKTILSRLRILLKGNDAYKVCNIKSSNCIIVKPVIDALSLLVNNSKLELDLIILVF